MRCIIESARVAAVLVLGITGFALTPHARGYGAPVNQPRLVSTAHASSAYAEALARAEWAKELRLVRQKELTADSKKLLELAIELKESMNTASSDRVSVSSLKVASKIEKLAHKLHQLMKE